MKKILCALMALLMLTGAACAEAPGTLLGFEILGRMSDGTENAVISPVSLACALAMAAEGAEGETEAALLAALGVETAAETMAPAAWLREAGLKLANAAFTVPGFETEAAYREALTDVYGAALFSAGEDPAEAVNEWVREQTDGLIEKLLEENGPQTAMVLVNAVAMDAEWRLPFTAEDTWPGTFHAPGGDVTAEMMHRTLWTDYGERDGVQLLRLEYAGFGLTMLIALPEAGGMAAVLEGLRTEGTGYFAFGEEEVKVKLTMPKTDVSSGGSLRGALEALGLGVVFGGDADFTGISGRGDLRIGDVIQRTRLILDEEGTRAAAATAVDIAMGAMPVQEEIVEFTMDRPFAVVIADEVTGSVCFAGVIANPVEIAAN